MAMTFAQLERRLLRRIGHGSMPEDESILTDAIADALSRLGRERMWLAYREEIKVNCVETYATGTVALAHGSTTVTLTDGTWPASVAGTALVLSGDGVHRPVASRTSDSEIVLEDEYNNVDGDNVSGQSYNLVTYRYFLDSDVRKVDDVRYAGNTYAALATRKGELEHANQAEMARLYTGAYQLVSSPHRYSVGSKNSPNESLFIDLWPLPLKAYTLDVTVHHRPAQFAQTDGVPDDKTEVLDVPEHLEKLLEAAALEELAAVFPALESTAERMWAKAWPRAIDRDTENAPVLHMSRGRRRVRRTPAIDVTVAEV